MTCRPIPLGPRDLLIHEVDTLKLCAAIRSALRFEVAAGAGLNGGGRSHVVGAWGAARFPVIMTMAPSEDFLLKEVEALVALVGAPFILLTPTATHCTVRVTGVLRRNRCAAIALSTALTPGERGKLLVAAPIDDALAEFDRALTRRGPGLASETYELRPKNHELRETSSQYGLRRGLGVWTLTFERHTTQLQDERGIHYVAHLLKNPPEQPIHGVALEAQVWAAEYELGLESTAAETGDKEDGEKTFSQRAANKKMAGDNALLKKKVRELLETIEDVTLPQTERDKAQGELDDISESLGGKAGRFTDDASRTVDRIRKAISRLHAKLAAAETDAHRPHTVLRSFAKHVEKHLMVPSARFAGSRKSRNRAGVAGTFTYEPPPGVVWER
jgi:hypothetical protein